MTRPSNEFPPEGRLAAPVELTFAGVAASFLFDVRSIRTLRQPMIVRSVWFDNTGITDTKSNIRISAVGFGSIILPVSPAQGILPLPCTNPAQITIEGFLSSGGLFPTGKLQLVFLNFDADPYEVAGLKP